MTDRVFKALHGLSVLAAVFLLGAAAHRQHWPPVPQIEAAYTAIVLQGGLNPRSKHLQPARGEGAGVTVNRTPGDGALILMAGYFDGENQIRLIRRDGTAVRKWSLDYFRHFPRPADRVCELAAPLWVDTHGLHMTPRGEVVFNYEYCGMVKLDPCGGTLWALSRGTHHALVPAAAGGYWSLGRIYWRSSEAPEGFPPFSRSPRDKIMAEDTVLRLAEDGSVIDEFSIPRLLVDGGLEAVLTATGENFSAEEDSREELVHANKVAELPAELAAAFPMFAAGDLVLSLRGLNLILVIDPATRAVKWHQLGPWLRQHDPEFRSDGRISVFNNNLYLTSYAGDQVAPGTPHATEILAVDPATGETETVYGGRPGQDLLSVIRGQHQLLDGGGLLITEFDAGRVVEVDAAGRTVWEYVNAHDEDYVGEITDALLYPADYLSGPPPVCGG